MQQEPVVFINGEILPVSKAAISPFDRGFRWGDAVYDVERTYRGEIFRLRKHMERLYRSLNYTRIRPNLSLEQMEQAIFRVLDINREFLGTNDDYMVTQVVSRGVIWPKDQVGIPTVVIYCDPIPFVDFAHRYIKGSRLITPSTRRTPAQSLSPNAKISNKMNHNMADFEAKANDPESYALMLDIYGNITEGPGNNFLFMADGCIKVPNRRNVLPGIAMTTILELAEGLGIPIDEGDYTPFSVYSADEAIITSTSIVALPVNTLNGVSIGREVPGPITKKLWQAWAELTGIHPVEQATAHLDPDYLKKLLGSRKNIVPNSYT